MEAVASIHPIEGDEVDNTGGAFDELGEGFSLFGGVVDFRNEEVFDGDFPSGGGVVVAHGGPGFGDIPLIIDGHETGANLINGTVEREGEVDRELVSGELPNLGDEADGAHREMAIAEADFVVEDVEGFDDVFNVEKRFSHSHENDMADAAFGERLEEKVLGDDFAGGEVAVEPAHSGRAEGAAHGASDL